MQALDALPHGQRAVIVLRYLSQLSEAETAATLEISTGTVKSQTARALARMREALTPEPARPQPGDNMNHVDDTELIDGLRARLLDRTADVHAPDRLADDARRLARRRATTRTVAVGIPVLAAADVATVRLASSGSPAAHTTTGPAASGVNAPVAQAQDTAYIVKRVTARLADGQGDTLIHEYECAGGEESSERSLVNLGPEGR